MSFTQHIFIYFTPCQLSSIDDMIRVLCMKGEVMAQILVVDDQEDIVQFVVKALELQNHKVTGLTSVATV